MPKGGEGEEVPIGELFTTYFYELTIIILIKEKVLRQTKLFFSLLASSELPLHVQMTR